MNTGKSTSVISLILIATAILRLSGCHSENSEPEYKSAETAESWFEDKFSMFIHWGLYSEAIMENYPGKKVGHRSASLLLVVDNPELLSGLKLFLNPWFDSIDVISNPNLIPSRIQKARYDVILLDMNFTASITSGNEGIYWLRQIIESEPDAVATAQKLQMHSMP
ncbi:MAG: hypothetical protein ACFCUM_14495 [Bacteroidales bacterium]